MHHRLSGGDTAVNADIETIREMSGQQKITGTPIYCPPYSLRSLPHPYFIGGLTNCMLIWPVIPLRSKRELKGGMLTSLPAIPMFTAQLDIHGLHPTAITDKRTQPPAHQTDDQ